MTAVLDLIISFFAGLSILFTLYFAWKAVQARSKSSREAYGVGRQEARQAMQIDLIRGVGFAFLGLILFGVSSLDVLPAEPEPSPPAPTQPLPISPTVTATPVGPLPTALATTTATTTAAPLPTVALNVTTTPSPAAPSPVVTLAPSATPTSTAQTATVSSGVGVWLRAEPGVEAEQLEWVLDGTVLTLLPGLREADDFEWQRVQTPLGNEGWVATPYIVYNQ